jgi:site-specific recombinase XerD
MNEFKLLFYLKNDKKNFSGDIAIYAKLTAGSKTVTFATKKFISNKRWDETNHLRKIIRNEDELEIQNYLKRIEKDINKGIEIFRQNNIQIEAAMLKQYLINLDLNELLKTAGQSITLLEIMGKYISRFNELVGKDQKAASTASRYFSIMKIVKDYLQNELKIDDIPVNEIDYSFIDNLYHFLRTKKEYREHKGCSNNTTVKYIRNIKTCCNYALKKGWIEKNPFLQYDMKLEETPTVYLTEPELESIENKKFDTERLNVVRDIFLFTCYTSIAPCDLINHTKRNIEEINGEKWLKYRRRKSNTQCDIPLIPRAERILNKYSNHPVIEHSGHLLPIKSDQKVNEYLKEIADLCGIDKRLCWYAGRHTFATIIVLANGVSLESLSKMMGHKRTTQTQHYAKILNSQVSNDMKKVKAKYS